MNRNGGTEVGTEVRRYCEFDKKNEMNFFMSRKIPAASETCRDERIRTGFLDGPWLQLWRTGSGWLGKSH